MKKNKLITLLALPFMMSLVGCGDSDASMSESPSEPSVSEPNSVEPTSPSTGLPSENPSVGQSTPSINPSSPSESASDPSVVPPTSTSTPSTSVEPDVPPVIDPNYGGKFELSSAESGDESIHIAGAGVWIWVTSSSIGYAEGANAIEYFDLEVTMTKGNTTIDGTEISLVGEIRDRVRVYITLHDAPGANDETAFDIKITNPNGTYYDGTVGFVGGTWSENVVVEPPVVDPVDPDNPNYAGKFELVSATSGDERIHIEGAGAWIWVKSSSIGYAEGVNAIEDFDLEVTMTKGNASIKESSLTLFGNIRDRVRVYVTLDGAPGTRDETAFYVKITAPNGKYYDNTVEFIGKNWTEAESPDKIDGGSFELYTEGTGNGANHIEGAGAWIWIKSSSVGYDGSNWSEIDVTDVQIDNDNFIIDNYFPSDPDAVRFRVYVLLDKGPVDSDSITFTIRIENATHYFVGTVSFLGTTLAD
ncbi:MAG: hypothetical protein J1F32_06675 [Erysipelotrichales bacterium]|nr:hypothetical protein [Erysipelotrichales bacterium]